MAKSTRIKARNISFGDAVTLAKESGQKIARKGWNGKGMWLMYAAGGTWKDTGNLVQGDLQPFLVMYTADKKFVPWLASQTDMLAKDWCTVE